MISVIVPTYNRRHNLRLMFTALVEQTSQDFEVIIADDGSDDATLGVVDSFASRLDITYCWRRHDGFRAGQARNMGAKLAQGSALLFIDSDILLNQGALEHYGNLHAANPSAIIAGRYDWLPPMRVKQIDITERWDALIGGALPKLRADDPVVGIIGPDPRGNIFDSSKVLWTRYALSVYSGNLLVPRQAYWELGAFDESMVGHGGEDCEFAIRAEIAGLPVIFAEEVIGYHVYHWRDQKRNKFEVFDNIAYIREKHDLPMMGIRAGLKGELPLVYREEEDDLNSYPSVQPKEQLKTDPSGAGQAERSGL